MKIARRVCPFCGQLIGTTTARAFFRHSNRAGQYCMGSGYVKRRAAAKGKGNGK